MVSACSTTDGSQISDSFFADRAFNYTPTQQSDITAYMLCFDTGVAPAVGATLTARSANIANSTLQSVWSTLEARAAAGDIDLIARGTISGQVRGLLYQPPSQNDVADNGTALTRADLTAPIQTGDILNIMGVYPGTGTASAK